MVQILDIPGKRTDKLTIIFLMEHKIMIILPTLNFNQKPMPVYYSPAQLLRNPNTILWVIWFAHNCKGSEIFVFIILFLYRLNT